MAGIKKTGKGLFADNKTALITGGCAIAAAIVAGAFGLFKKAPSPTQSSNNIAGSNINHSVSIVGNQTGNNTITENSISTPQAVSVGQNLAPFYAPQSTTVNNYYGIVSNSVTREAFEALDNRLATATNRIELTVSEVRLLAQALRDLDQRTSDVEKLPDGRTKFGTIITGRPKAVIEAFGLAVQSYTNRDYAGSLNQARAGIEAFEASAVDGSLVSGEITPNAKGILYRIAGQSAQSLGSNILANQYAEKAVVVDPSNESRLLLATTLANLGSEKLRENDGLVALSFYSKAIDAYEASRKTENNQTASLFRIDANRIYGSAFTTAWALGSNALALEFAEKAANNYPTNHLNQIRLAVALGRVGRKDEGIALIDRTYGADTNNPEAIELKETIRAGFLLPR